TNLSTLPFRFNSQVRYTRALIPHFPFSQSIPYPHIVPTPLCSRGPPSPLPCALVSK
ncbi:hypothetical protein COCCADRAFT_109982, partial [Bipolaris zeicola 26-R-13]